MKMDIRKKWPVAALSLIGMASTVSAARNDDKCGATPPATCYPSDCRPCHCLGPENYGVNAPVGPKTCNGDFFINVAGFYWNAHQDGMEYAVRNRVQNPGESPELSSIETLNNLVDARYQTPDYGWDFGFKLGVGYTTTCDGWDIGVLWTWYKGKANDKIEAEPDDNETLVTLWSAFAPVQGSVVYATDITTNWKLELNLIDIELGRQFWTSKYLSLRPHVGLRVAYIKQDWNMSHRGGSWSSRGAVSGPPAIGSQDAFNNEAKINNDFKGVGVRGGLNSEWNFGCGWALYGDMAASIVYGRFDIDHDETNRFAVTPHTKRSVLETEDTFRASRGMLDLALGLQWSTMFCNCSYGFTARLGWEHHLFFDQNQMWRVNRIGDQPVDGVLPVANNNGENVFQQRRGDLDTQGWTLSFKFEF